MMIYTSYGQNFPIRINVKEINNYMKLTKYIKKTNKKIDKMMKRGRLDKIIKKAGMIEKKTDKIDS